MPAYNESHIIEEVITGCKKYVDKVIVVDDGSSDRTIEIAEIKQEIRLKLEGIYV
jgi:dolichol-phosphate mannosyltransferase